MIAAGVFHVMTGVFGPPVLPVGLPPQPESNEMTRTVKAATRLCSPDAKDNADAEAALLMGTLLFQF
jgi:hypothetical protein